MTKEKTALVESGRLNDELETLIDIGKALTSHLTLEDVYRVVMEKVGNLLRPQAWSLLIIKEETNELCYEIVVSPEENNLTGTSLESGEGVASWVAESGIPLLAADISKDPRFSYRSDRHFGFVTQSVVCVPLVSNNRIIGVIELLNGVGRNPFTKQDQRILSTIADFTAIAIENSRLHQQVRDLTISDDLTGLYNAHHFQTLCDYEIERARRYGNQMSIVFLDLDHFKNVNDSYGHLTGSRLLKEVGELFSKVVRVVDHAARYGGDEFIFLLPSTSKEGAMKMAQNLLGTLRKAEFVSDCGKTMKITASLGVATYPADAESIQELIKRSDEAMYEVKRSNRNGVRSA